MPRREKYFRCASCTDCLERGDINSHGVRIGRLLPMSSRVAHLARIQNSRPQIPFDDAESPSTEFTADMAEELSNRVFAATLDDDGVNVDEQPSRLFCTRAEYQAECTPDTVYPPDIADVANLIDGFRQLNLMPVNNPDQPTPVQSTHSLPTPVQSVHSLLKPVQSTHSLLTPVQSTHSLPVALSNQNRDPLSKKEKHHATLNAHHIMDRVQDRIEACWQTLEQPMTRETLQQVELEHSRLLATLRNCSRQVTSVIERRSALGKNLASLGDMIRDKHSFMPEDKTPLFYDTGEFLLRTHGLYFVTRKTSAGHYNFKVDTLSEVAQVSLFLGVVCSIIMGVSRRAGNFIMQVILLLLKTAMAKTDGDLSARDDATLSEIPSSIESAQAKFNLDGKTTTYAVCPSCHCTYKPTPSLAPSTVEYPSHCKNVPSPDSPICNTPLLDSKSHPKKIFVYHHFHDYLARLLSCSELEGVMNKVCDDVVDGIGDPPDFLKDIFDGSYLREFRGPNGRLFLDRGNEGRYIFSLNVDFFNREGMKIRGPTVSCGIISMACMNLPKSIRYKPEYMYLAGIIPPMEPHLDELNHYLRPVVDDFVVSWARGVRYSRTHASPTGLTTRSAIAVGVNDLPASRKVAQHVAVTSHHICISCNCFHKSSLGRTDFEHEDWKAKDNDQMRKCAEAWNNAPTMKDRIKLAEETGLRYSELWRLEYWNPARQMAIDSMHCLLEGLAQDHFRSCLGLVSSTQKPKSSPSFSHPFKVPSPSDQDPMVEKEIKQVKQIHDLLTSANPESTFSEHLKSITRKLGTKNAKPLQYVYTDLGLVCTVTEPTGQAVAKTAKLTKGDIVDALVEWVSKSLVQLGIVTHILLEKSETMEESWVTSRENRRV
jgi:hypothetical protein